MTKLNVWWDIGTFWPIFFLKLLPTLYQTTDASKEQRYKDLWALHVMLMHFIYEIVVFP